MISAHLQMILVRRTPSLGRFARTCLPAVITVAVIPFLFCGLASPARAVHEEWNRRWDGPKHQYDAATQVAVDKDGNVYVAGFSDDLIDGGRGNYRLIKYGPDGTELWNRIYVGPSQGADRITGLALDTAGDAYVTGYSERDESPRGHFRVNFDYATLKYDPNGNQLWVRRYNGLNSATKTTDSNDFSRPTSIAVDGHGNAYVTGATTSSGWATIKYGPNGQVLWTQLYSGGYYASYLALDTAGNVYVAGDTVDSTEKGAVATVKYSPDGSQLWVRHFDRGRYASVAAIAVDAAHGVYVAGSVGTRAVPNAYLTLRYDTDGHEIWQNSYSHENPNSAAYALAVDSAGNVVVTGNNGTLKYGLDGTLLWVKGKVGGSTVKVDAADDVYVASGSGVPNNYNFLLVKYGADGDLHWDRIFHGPAHGNDFVYALTLDDEDNVYVAGVSDQSYYSNTSGDIRTVKYSQ